MNERILSMISLGCAKNLVDTEGVLGALVEAGWLLAADPQDADLVLINTCGFIEDARQESTEAIENILELKQAGAVRAVVVMGCMVQLMREKLTRRFGDVDAWVGLADPGTVAEACNRALAGLGQPAVWMPDPAARPLDQGPRLRITPRHIAYLRIAEGCNNRCHYCQIPDIRGPLRSKPADQVLAEAHQLVADGARELIVIAQDTTSYGVDLHGEPRLAGLLGQLRQVDGVRWLRLLYTHPAHFGDQVIAALAEGPPLLPYVDLPIQHATDAILEAMGRGTTQADLRALVDRIRDAVPGAVLRTSVIVGFPGEGDTEFNELLDFIREVRFDRLGAFAYSLEPGTPAAELDGQVDPEVKAERLAAVMELQQDLATERSEALVGSDVDVVVDGKGIDGEWTGRTAGDAPDVDGTIRLEGPHLEPGLFGRATVTEAWAYDLYGWLIDADPTDD